jgi:hypothetical protein
MIRAKKNYNRLMMMGKFMTYLQELNSKRNFLFHKSVLLTDFRFFVKF